MSTVNVLKSDGSIQAVPASEFASQPIDPSALAADALSRMAQWISEFEAKIIGPVSPAEQLSWAEKEAAARAYHGSSASAEQLTLLQAEAGLTGETLADLSTKIITQADAFRPIVGMIAGLRRKTEEAVNLAATDPQSDEATFDAILTAAQTQALTLAQQLGLSV